MTIKVLFLAANPSDTEPIGCIRERQSILADLMQHKIGDVFDIVAEFGTTADQLSSFIRNHQPHVLHLSMHGDNQFILLEGENQTSQPLLGDAAMQNIGIICADVETVQCAVLAYCSSYSHAPVLFDNVPNVIGMPDAMNDDAAITYVTAFYRLVGLGKDFYAAHKGANAEIRQFPEWQQNGLPVFFGPNKQTPLLATHSTGGIVPVANQASARDLPLLTFEDTWERSEGTSKTSFTRKIAVSNQASLQILVDRGLFRDFGYVYSDDLKSLN